MSDPEEQIPSDLPDRLDEALEAFWQGDSGAFERLLESDELAGPGVSSLTSHPPTTFRTIPPLPIQQFFTHRAPPDEMREIRDSFTTRLEKR